LEFSITFHKDNIIVNNEIVMMNKTNLAVIAVLAAAALLVGTVATTAAFASTSFSLKQSIKQKQEQAGIVNLGEQNAQNNLCVLTGANCGRQ
jgi:hypothetical protein